MERQALTVVSANVDLASVCWRFGCPYYLHLQGIGYWKRRKYSLHLHHTQNRIHINTCWFLTDSC